MKNYWKEILLVAVIIAAAWYLFSHSRITGISSGDGGAGDGATVECETETFTINDEWLEPELAKGQKIEAITNWRECGREIARGQIVLYRVSPAHEPVARAVAGAPGDTFKLSQPPEKNFWHIEINGDEFTERPEKRYHFGSAAPPALKIYEQAHSGKLDPSSVVLLSKKSPGDQDSGSLGVLNTADIVGIVAPK